MRRKNGNPYTIKGSGISSFSVIGFLCFFLIIPLVLSLFVILDYNPYVKGYEEHLKTAISSNEIDDLNAQISKIEKQIDYAEEQIAFQEESLNAQKNSQIAIQENAISVKQAELDSVSKALNGAQEEADALKKVIAQTKAVLENNSSVEITDSQVKLLKASMDTLNAKIATYNSQIETLESEIDEVKQKREKVIDSMTGNVEITKDTTSVSYPSSITLDADNDTTYATEYIGYTEVYFYSITGNTEPTNDELADILSDARKDQDDIDNTLKVTLDALTDDFNVSKGKIAEYIAAYNIYKGAYEQADIDGDTATRDQNLKAMNQTQGLISSELTNLQNIQAQINPELTKLTSKLTAMENHRQALHTGKEAIRETFSNMYQSEIDNKNIQIDNLNNLIDVLEDEIDGYETQLTAYKQEQETALGKQNEKVSKLSSQKSNIQTTLQALNKELEALKNKQPTNNVTEAYEAQIQEYNKNIEAIQSNIAELNYLCSLTGSKFLEAAYADNYDDIYPYPKENADGAFGLTAMLVSDMNVSVGLLNMLPALCFTIAAVLAVLTLAVVIIRSYIARKTTYTLEENVLTITKATVFTGHEETRKVFYSPGMSVSVQQTLKGAIFNYGDVVVSMGLGNAGEIVMRNVKKPNKAKRILTEKLAKLSYVGYPHNSNIPNMCNSPYAYGFGLPYGGFGFPYMGGFGGFGFPYMGMGNTPDCSKCMLRNMLPEAVPQQPQEVQQ